MHDRSTYDAYTYGSKMTSSELAPIGASRPRDVFIDSHTKSINPNFNTPSHYARPL